MESLIKVPNVNNYLAEGHFQKKVIHSNVLLPTGIYWKFEGTALSAYPPGHTMQPRQAVIRRGHVPRSGLLLNQ